jgi:aerobic-type carbon monoxide dehydrogenase small subunit (CoxS/CutS family)
LNCDVTIKDPTPLEAEAGVSLTVRFRVNGDQRSVTTDPERRLLDVLREELQLTGTKYGCGEGQCGACLVLVDGEPARSCLLPVRAVDGRP